jgi:hypothetical protein
VRTFLATVQLLITFRDRVHGLLLSEMGGLLLDPEHERAGTKRLANLVHSPRWSAELIEQFLWHCATPWLSQGEQDGQPVYAIWDERVWEKPESWKMEDLGPVRSSKAQRLTHYKPGYDRPAARPIFVPGLHWLGLILVGAKARAKPPAVASMRWWSSRGPHAATQRKQEAALRAVPGCIGVLPYGNRSSCAGPTGSISLMRKDRRAKPGRSHAASGPGARARSAMPMCIALDRPACSPFPCGIPILLCLCGWSSHVKAQGVAAALSSPPKKCEPKHKPGRSSSPLRAAGTVRARGALTRVHWHLNVPACASGGTATNCC